MDWMLLPLRRYVDFDGRSRRTEYWMYALLQFLVYGAFSVLLLAGLPWTEMLDPNYYGPEPMPGVLFWIGLVLMMLFWLATLLPTIAVTIRRLHDQDQSGWLYLLSFIPYVGGFVLLIFMCLPGTVGPNRFGPDPKDPNHAGVFR